MTTEMMKADAIDVGQYVDRMAERWPGSIEGRRRFQAIAVSVALKDPALAACSLKSKLIALNCCAMLGLVPDAALGHVYLVPFNNRKTGTSEVNPIIGYRGLIELARRSGYLTAVQCREVYENDEFDHDMGTREQILHRSWRAVGQTTPGPLVAAYCIATLSSGEKQHEVMYRDEIESIRQRSKAGKYGPWQTDYAMMCRKTVLRRAAKTWPLSAELARAVEMDERIERGEQPFLPGDDSLPAPASEPAGANVNVRLAELVELVRQQLKTVEPAKACDSLIEWLGVHGWVVDDLENDDVFGAVVERVRSENWKAVIS